MSEIIGPLGGKPGETCGSCKRFTAMSDLYETPRMRAHVCIATAIEVDATDFCDRWEARQKA